MDHSRKTTSFDVSMDNIDTESSKIDVPSTPPDTTDDVSHSLVFRAMILFQVLAYGSYSVLVHLCERDGVIMFSSTTMNLFLELIKLVFSFITHLVHSSNIWSLDVFNGFYFRHSLPYSIPGLLYFINNNLAVHMQLQMDPASYQVLSNFKIVTTAILYRIIMKHKLLRRQWFAVMLLFCGGLFYSLGAINSSTKIGEDKVRRTYIYPLGFLMIFIYCILSGLAGVYNEWILKKYYSESLHVQNIYLYSYGTLLNLIPAIGIPLIKSQSFYKLNLLQGFSIYTWLIIVTQALNGLFMDPRFTNETLAYLQLAAENSSTQGNTFEVEALRQQFENLHQKSNEKLHGTFKGTIEEKTIKTNSTEIPITIYTPKDVNKDKLVVFYHGGGWVIGSRKTHQTAVNTLADATKTIWISVEYRLAPEHKYPSWLDDASAAAQHIIQNKTTYGVSSTAKIGVAGDSAGGLIATSVARMVKNISFQILLYAVTDLLGQSPSRKELAHPMYVVTPQLMDWLMEQTYESSNDWYDPRISIQPNTSFEGMPPCLFIVAELDPLRDENIEYHKLLEKAGVSTQLVLVKGTIHGFLGFLGMFPQASAEAIAAICTFMELI